MDRWRVAPRFLRLSALELIVDRDPLQVCPDRGLAAEAIQRVEESDERFLPHIVGVVAGPEHADHRARNRRLMLLDNAPERRLIAPPRPLEEVSLLGSFQVRQPVRVCHSIGVPRE